MQRKITLERTVVSYTLKRSKRARRLRISIDVRGSVVLTLPYRTSEIAGERFLRTKASWILRKMEESKKHIDKIFLSSTPKEYKARKAEAKLLVHERLKYWNQFYNFTYNQVFIKNQKTRWGSCSKKGNLNFSYRLVTLPLELADYIIVHELCHLKEFNHSKKFWSQVERTLPNYLELRKRLNLFRGILAF